jgi:hypothetical protein
MVHLLVGRNHKVIVFPARGERRRVPVVDDATEHACGAPVAVFVAVAPEHFGFPVFQGFTEAGTPPRVREPEAAFEGTAWAGYFAMR